jgi:hypothetical protein
VKEVQALSLTTIAKMVQSASPDQLRPHFPQLVPAMLESLSGLEVRPLLKITRPRIFRRS